MTQSSYTNYFSDPFTLGFFRASLMFPLEHFVDMTKVSAQKSPHLSSWKVIGDIYREKALRGFLEGARVNFPRRVLRDTVRWPVVGYSYHLLTKNFPEVFPEKSTVSSVFSGIAAAAFDSLVLGPLELLMAYRIKENKQYTEFFQKKILQQGISSLYRGAGLNLAYRSSVWSMYMGVNSEMNKQFSSLDEAKLLPYTREVTSAVISSTALIATLLPLDFIKTHIQMDSTLQGKKTALVAKTLFKRHGLSGFYAGASILWVNNIVYGLVFQKVVANAMDSFKETSTRS